MTTDGFTIFGFDDNPRTLVVKIVAAAQNIPLKQSLVIPRNDVNKATYMEQFPLSQGKIPAIQSTNIELTEVIAISYYFAKLHPETHLLGSAGTLEQEAEVLSFSSFANMELLKTLACWFLPLVPGVKNPVPYNYNEVEAGKQASFVLLDKVEKTLTGKKWLVGDGPTLADIFTFVMIGRGLQMILGREWRLAHPAIMAHWNAVENWEPVQRLGYEWELVEVETPNAKPAPWTEDESQ